MLPHVKQSLIAYPGFFVNVVGTFLRRCETMSVATFCRAVRARTVVVLAGVSAFIMAPAVSHADQFVLFDVTFTYTKADADNSKPSKSHYYVKGDALNPNRPKDWTAPVDYRNGTVHIRLEALEK